MHAWPCRFKSPSGLVEIVVLAFIFVLGFIDAVVVNAVLVVRHGLSDANETFFGVDRSC